MSFLVDSCGCAAKLDLHAALLQIGNEILVRVARRDAAIRTVFTSDSLTRMSMCSSFKITES
jgi:hypothetical protein